MEQVETTQSKGSKRKTHPAPKIDMTPMVDLGFLLITFFIFTTSMAEKKVMKLIMPVDSASSITGENKVLTVLLGAHNKVFAYEGKFEEAIVHNTIVSTSYNEIDGMGKLIRNKQKQLERAHKKEGREALVFLIKATSGASYKNVIDALDETTINNVKKFMLLDASEEEKARLQQLDQ